MPGLRWAFIICKRPNKGNFSLEMPHTFPAERKVVLLCVQSENIQIKKSSNKDFLQPKITDIFPISPQNICCGYSLEVPPWGTSNENPQHVYMKNYFTRHHFYLEICDYSSTSIFTVCLWTLQHLRVSEANCKGRPDYMIARANLGYAARPFFPVICFLSLFNHNLLSNNTANTSWHRFANNIVKCTPIFTVCCGHPVPFLTLFQQTTFWNIFIFFPRKLALTFHGNCLLRTQFEWNVKACFLGKIRKILSICPLLS